MRRLEKYRLEWIAIFIWIGFVCAISFMEAWLKFRAELVTLPIGLSIGRIVFGALNKIEWFFAIWIVGFLLIRRDRLKLSQWLLFALPLCLLVIQTLWLLPALNERAATFLSGGKPPPSFTHFYYLFLEVVKVICLFVFGLSLIKNEST